MFLEKYLTKMRDIHGSDLHLISNDFPKIRIDGSLEKCDNSLLSPKDLKLELFNILNDTQKKELETNLELDFAFNYQLNNPPVEERKLNRYRANFYYVDQGIACAIRAIPTNVPSLDSINAPSIYKELINREKGLILVTGPTGSGKSTTLAAMLDYINQNYKKHIVTIEDPIEFKHKSFNSSFSQREVGENTHSFEKALKSVLRQDPDVILIGELRDRETISAALTAAETGHLVFGTLHSSSSISTISRIIDVFPGDAKNEVRTQLSSVLISSISQTLIPKINGGRLAISEILINNPAISNSIRTNKDIQIKSQMQTGREQYQMQDQTFEINNAIREGLITKENGKQFANNKDEIK